MARRGYPPEIRRRPVEMVRAGRSPVELAEEFEPSGSWRLRRSAAEA